MNRYTRLAPISRRKLKREGEYSWRKEANRQERALDLRTEREKAEELKALTYGCEYGQEYLRGQFRAHGCDLCSKFHPPEELHHTKTRARGGRAEDQVKLGLRCHSRGHTMGWKRVEEEFGVDLKAVASKHAAEGLRLGYLPVERCQECGEWHSVRYMLDGIDGEEVTRICKWCAPEGPP